MGEAEATVHAETEAEIYGQKQGSEKWERKKQRQEEETEAVGEAAVEDSRPNGAARALRFATPAILFSMRMRSDSTEAEAVSRVRAIERRARSRGNILRAARQRGRSKKVVSTPPKRCTRRYTRRCSRRWTRRCLGAAHSAA